MNEHSNNISDQVQIDNIESNLTLNLSLEDLPNEEWVDALEYDGIYQVSSYGRIKSLAREVNTRWGTPRLVKEKILKQSVLRAKNGRIDGLSISIGKTKNSAKFIFQSFYPDVDFDENECVMHINKNCIDNRIENLKKVTRKKSKKVDMVKSIRTIIATPQNWAKAVEERKEFFENRTHKQCSTCGKVELVDKFPNDKSKCQDCINNYVVERRKNYVPTNNKKECNRCGVLKLDKEFPKLDNTCKKCRTEIHKQYQIEQRETLGDWYVKEYGKYTYGYKEFSDELIETLRNEIKEKRKPKHTYDGKEFKTTKEFAEYVFKKYKVPIATVKKRVSEGRSEYECTLNRKQFLNHNKENRAKK